MDFNSAGCRRGATNASVHDAVHDGKTRRSAAIVAIMVKRTLDLCIAIVMLVKEAADKEGEDARNC